MKQDFFQTLVEMLGGRLRHSRGISDTGLRCSLMPLAFELYMSYKQEACFIWAVVSFRRLYPYELTNSQGLYIFITLPWR